MTTKIDCKGVLALLKKATFLQAYFPETGGNEKRSFQLTCGIERDRKVGKETRGTFTEYHRINVGITATTPAPAVYMYESYGTMEAIKLLLIEAFKEAEKQGREQTPVFHARRAFWDSGDQRAASFTVEAGERYGSFTHAVYALYVGSVYLHLAEPGFDVAQKFTRVGWALEADNSSDSRAMYSYEYEPAPEKPWQASR